MFPGGRRSHLVQAARSLLDLGTIAFAVQLFGERRYISQRKVPTHNMPTCSASPATTTLAIPRFVSERHRLFHSESALGYSDFVSDPLRALQRWSLRSGGERPRRGQCWVFDDELAVMARPTATGAAGRTTASSTASVFDGARAALLPGRKRRNLPTAMRGFCAILSLILRRREARPTKPITAERRGKRQLRCGANETISAAGSSYANPPSEKVSPGRQQGQGRINLGMVAWGESRPSEQIWNGVISRASSRVDIASFYSFSY